MASGRQRRKIGKKKKMRKRRKEKMTRAATACKKIVKKTDPLPRERGAETGLRRRPLGSRSGSRMADEAAAAPVKKTCSVCAGGRQARESFCPYNYVHGRFGVSTCRERCRPGRHPLHERRREALRRFVRVSNVPLDVVPGERELHALFERFGPLKCALTAVTLWDRVGFGYAVFEVREHAEAAVDWLNGHRVGDRRLRVDWAYPRA